MAVTFKVKDEGVYGLKSLVKIKTNRCNIEWSIDNGSVNVILQRIYMYLGPGFNAEGVK